MQRSYENGGAECLVLLQSIQSAWALHSTSETLSEFAWSEINPYLSRLKHNIYSCAQGKQGQDASGFSKPVFGIKFPLGKKQGHKNKDI